MVVRVVLRKARMIGSCNNDRRCEWAPPDVKSGFTGCCATIHAESLDPEVMGRVTI